MVSNTCNGHASMMRKWCLSGTVPGIKMHKNGSESRHNRSLITSCRVSMMKIVNFEAEQKMTNNCSNCERFQCLNGKTYKTLDKTNHRFVTCFSILYSYIKDTGIQLV